MKRLLVVLDFDGLLVNSYALLRQTFERFDLDVGDEHRFRNRRKFLKYIGGGKEFITNLTTMAMPSKQRIREELTRNYCQSGQVFAQFVPYINTCINDPAVHIGIVSRNFALNPGVTMRQVLLNSGIDESSLDFVIPLSVGSKKNNVLEGMKAARYHDSLFAGDEIGDYRAAVATGYTTLIGTYGFDNRKRLLERGDIPPGLLFDSVGSLCCRLWRLSLPHLSGASFVSANARRSSSVRPSVTHQSQPAAAPLTPRHA